MTPSDTACYTLDTDLYNKAFRGKEDKIRSKHKCPQKGDNKLTLEVFHTLHDTVLCKGVYVFCFMDTTIPFHCKSLQLTHYSEDYVS